jgi:5-methylcytosine-specific restriction endonuclease McrA
MSFGRIATAHVPTRALERRRIRIESGHVPITESRQRREQTELLRQRRDVPCADCLHRFPFFAMDFDHRNPIDKAFEVPRMLGRVDTERLLEEASKCDIVCANCHRKRTHEQRSGNAGVA